MRCEMNFEGKKIRGKNPRPVKKYDQNHPYFTKNKNTNLLIFNAIAAKCA